MRLGGGGCLVATRRRLSVVYVTDRPDVASALEESGAAPVVLVDESSVPREILGALVVWVECRAQADAMWTRADHHVVGWCPDDDEPRPDRTAAEVVAMVAADDQIAERAGR